MNKAKLMKLRDIALNVLLYIFLAICVISVILTVTSKKDSDGAAEIFGYQMRIVVSESMAESEFTDVSDFEIGSLPLRTLIFVETVPDGAAEAQEWYGNLKVGDVLTFKYVYTNQVTITHRIISIEENQNGGYTIKLEGDNKTDEEMGLLTQVIDTSVTSSPNYVVGKVVGQSHLIGWIISILKSTLGIIFAIILPCLVIIIMQIIKIVQVVGADKRKKRDEEDARKDQELKELKEKLALLEKMSAASADASARSLDESHGDTPEQ